MAKNHVITITTARDYYALHSWLEAMEQMAIASRVGVKSSFVTPPFTDDIEGGCGPNDSVSYFIEVDEEVSWNVSTPAHISVVFAGNTAVTHHRGDIEAIDRAKVTCKGFVKQPQTPGTIILHGRSNLEAAIDMENVGPHVIAHDFATWRSRGGMDVRADGCTRGWAANSTVQLDGNAAATASFASSIRADGNSVVWTQDPSMVEVVGLGAHVQVVDSLFGETDSFD